MILHKVNYRKREDTNQYNHSQWSANYPINSIAINYQIISAMNKTNYLNLDSWC